VYSDKEVNISAKDRLEVENRMSKPNKQTFDVAQAVIFDLMKEGPFKEFLQSKYCERLLNKITPHRQLERKNSSGTFTREDLLPKPIENSQSSGSIASLNSQRLPSPNLKNLNLSPPKKVPFWKRFSLCSSSSTSSVHGEHAI
jgi:hypothetical protein